MKELDRAKEEPVKEIIKWKVSKTSEKKKKESWTHKKGREVPYGKNRQENRDIWPSIQSKERNLQKIQKVGSNQLQYFAK